MTRMTTEEAFVKVLQMHGIEHAFGIIGSAFMPISDLFPKAGITFWDVAHEVNGGLICDGYTRTTGKIARQFRFRPAIRRDRFQRRFRFMTKAGLPVVLRTAAGHDHPRATEDIQQRTTGRQPVAVQRRLPKFARVGNPSQVQQMRRLNQFKQPGRIFIQQIGPVPGHANVIAGNPTDRVHLMA